MAQECGSDPRGERQNSPTEFIEARGPAVPKPHGSVEADDRFAAFDVKRRADSGDVVRRARGHRVHRCFDERGDLDGADVRVREEPLRPRLCCQRDETHRFGIVARKRRSMRYALLFEIGGAKKGRGEFQFAGVGADAAFPERACEASFGAKEVGVSREVAVRSRVVPPAVSRTHRSDPGAHLDGFTAGASPAFRDGRRQ
ncbi:hypothetical protein, partial [Microbacterium sp. Leaf351]|uniref:hypothetical protein n=1 Tax=Microbacterium sp. Leaf351 TaxID=1736348 RepID=UPI001F3F68AC